MVALALVAAAFTVMRADTVPVAVHGGIAFARHTNYADTFVDWHGHVRPYAREAVWSPHGTYVAHPNTECENGNCENWAVVSRADGSHRHVLPDAGIVISWSADESSLVYVNSFDQLQLANGDGTDAHVAAVDPVACGATCTMQLADARPSPDGRSVALILEAASNAPGHLYVVSSAGGTPVPTGGDDLCPPDSDIQWSPDGAWIAYVGNSCLGDVDYLEVTSPDGRAHGLDVRLVGPYAWSSSADLIAAQVRDGVTIANPRARLFTAFGAHSPSWSPDGQRLTYEWHGSIRVLNPTSGRGRAIARGRSPVWTSHGIAWAVPQCGARQGIWLAGRRLTDLCQVYGPHGTRWPDEVWANDHRREHVGCGAGHDIAHADRNDVVASDCERVLRH